MSFSTADLCDRYSSQDGFQIAEPIFRHFGGLTGFCGQISTLKIFEDYVQIEQILSERGEGRILVVDGGGSKRCALLGKKAAGMAYDNGWQGIVVYGCVRDSSILAHIPMGILALHAHPLKSHKHCRGECDVMITFAGVNFKKAHYLYVDADGMVVFDSKLD